MQHLLAFNSTVAAAAVNEALAVEADAIFRNASATAFIAPQPIKVYGAYLQSATSDGGRLNTPRMRYVSLPRISGPVIGVLPGNTTNWTDWRDYPMQIDQSDQFGVDASDTGAGVAVWAGLWVGTDLEAAPRGPVSTIQANSTTAAVANQWTTIALTFADNLPQGVYDVVGIRYVAAASVFGRLLPPGGGWRPGCLGCATEGALDLGRFRYGFLGRLTSFDAFNPPGFEVYCTGATAVHRVYMDVVRRGGFGSPLP